MSDTPEAQARENIDQQLEACGWVVQNRSEVDLTASLGVAVREFALNRGTVVPRNLGEWLYSLPSPYVTRWHRELVGHLSHGDDRQNCILCVG